MGSAEYGKILYQENEGVAHIRLNLPGQLNPLGIGPGSMREEIAHALACANDNADIGCVLISANGRAFSAGGDLSASVANESAMQAQRFGRRMVQFYEGVRNVEKPVIAAVQGLCIGAGLGLIAQCDLVVAADDARFGLIEGRVGFPGAAELVPIIGPVWAKFLILSGEMIPASRAERIGLVLSVEPADQLIARSAELAVRIARMPREAVALNKASINAVTDAMGAACARVAGRAHENLVLLSSKSAMAPDGRRFSDILQSEGISGMKKARNLQFAGSWLSEESTVSTKAH